MALINTDWTKELAQVENTLVKFLDEKLEPMADRILDRGINESSILLAKASFEVQEAIKQATHELDIQRKMAIKEIKRLIFYAGVTAAVFVGLTAVLVVISLRYLNFL